MNFTLGEERAVPFFFRYKVVNSTPVCIDTNLGTVLEWMEDTYFWEEIRT